MCVINAMLNQNGSKRRVSFGIWGITSVAERKKKQNNKPTKNVNNVSIWPASFLFSKKEATIGHLLRGRRGKFGPVTSCRTHDVAWHFHTGISSQTWYGHARRRVFPSLFLGLVIKSSLPIISHLQNHSCNEGVSRGCWEDVCEEEWIEASCSEYRRNIYETDGICDWLRDLFLGKTLCNVIYKTFFLLGEREKGIRISI